MRRGFTLIELMIATALSAVVIFAFYALIDNTKNSQKTLVRSLVKNEQDAMFYKVLSLDILQSSEIDFKKNILRLKTPHTLYERFDANVIYVYNKKSKQLLRVESAQEYNLYKNLNESFLDDVSIDVVLDNVDSFVVNSDKNRLKIVVYVSIGGKQKVYGFKRFIETIISSDKTTN